MVLALGLIHRHNQTAGRQSEWSRGSWGLARHLALLFSGHLHMAPAWGHFLIADDTQGRRIASLAGEGCTGDYSRKKDAKLLHLL